MPRDLEKAKCKNCGHVLIYYAPTPDDPPSIYNGWQHLRPLHNDNCECRDDVPREVP